MAPNTQDHIRLKVSLLDILVIIWWLYIIVRTYFVDGTPCTEKLCIYTTLVSIYILFRFLFSVIPVKPNALEYLILALSIFEMLYGIMQLIIGRSNHALYLITGTFLNPGPYSASIAMGLALSLYGLTHKNGKWEHRFYWGSILLGVLILAITLSRSAIIASAIITILIYRDKITGHRRFFVISVTLLLSVLLFIIKQGSAMGRLMIWSISWDTLLHQPIWGYGVNGFEGAYADGLRRFFETSLHIKAYAKYVDVTEYAFNDFIQIAIEQGLIGFSLGLSVVILIMLSLWRHNKPVFYSFHALLLFALFSYPLQLMPYQAFFVICAAYAGSEYTFSAILGHRLLFCLLCIGGCLSYVSIKNIIRIETAQKEFMILGIYQSASLVSDYADLAPNLMESKRFLFAYAKVLTVSGRYLDSNAIITKGKQLSNDPMFDVIMGNNYASMNFPEEADSCYKAAHLQMPNRLYPLYKRIKLYQSMNNHQMARKLARELEGFEPKIPSPATRKMMKEIDSIAVIKR